MALIAAQEICNLYTTPPELPFRKQELLEIRFHDCDATVCQLKYLMTLSESEESILFDWPMPDDFKLG